MKQVVVQIFIVWMAWVLFNTAEFSHAYMDEGDVPEPDPEYNQLVPSSKNQKRSLKRRIRKKPHEVRHFTPTGNEDMILKGEQMIIEGKALKEKGELLMRDGWEWIEKGNKKRENSKWMQQQIEKAKGETGK